MRTFHNRQSRSLQALANFFNSFAGNLIAIIRALLDADTNMHSIRLQADNTLQLFLDTLLMLQPAVFTTVAAPKGFSSSGSSPYLVKAPLFVLKHACSLHLRIRHWNSSSVKLQCVSFMPTKVLTDFVLNLPAIFNSQTDFQRHILPGILRRL